MMVEAFEEKRYRGVLCLCCRQPIPLPAIASRREPTSESAPAQRGDRVYSLRCRACDKEMPYRESAVVEIEGTPRNRASRAHDRAKLLRGQNPLSRAANG